MATKLYIMSELARQTTERLTQSIDNWKRFLDSAAWLYKYPFHEQVLIHAQRPDAKACAPIELWNSKFRRWVNRGAKGIAIIDDSGQKPTLRHVFDVSDTNTRYNVPFSLWQTRPEYEAQIVEELQNHFGDIGVEDADFSSAVLGIAINAVSDNYDDYKNELLKAVGNSALADMSDDEISSTFMVLLMTSVAHTVFVRLGIDPAAIFHGDEYESIRLFNSPDTIVQLGAATSDISEMILRQIERSVRSMERQELGTLAKSQQVLQNEDRKNERSAEHGTQLQAERGLPDSRYQNGRSADGDDRQIRQNAEDVSQGASERDLQLPAASEQADGASVGDRQDGAGTGRTDDGADGADRERDREDESRESDALDSANEQHSAESRGDGTERPDLRITEYSLFPTLEEQLQRIEEAEAQKLSAFSVSQADLDNELCRHGSGFAQGKFRIYKFFEDKVELSVTAENRIKGMVKIRDCTRKLIEYQLEGYSDDLIRQEQQTLNRLYDEFTSQYGLLNSRANNTAFSDDSSYCLLCSLEVLDENGALVRKADMFSKRTIRQQEPVTSCDTAADALAVSLSEKAKVDLQYMGKLTGKTEEQLTEDLAGIIFFNPSSEQYETADEYLSGDVRWKLRLLKEIDNPKYAANMEALEKVQPNDLTASEIDVRLGAIWIPPEDIQRFVIELLKPAYYASSKIKVHYSRLTAQWNISGKTSDYGNVTANVTYGTKRINAYKIIEETLNLKDVRIFDTVYDESSGEKRILNRNETVLAQQKQQLIKDAFRDWLWKDPDRRDRLTTLYNTKFNSIRPREYDGSHIRFVGMNPEITLRPHQVNAVARVIYGGNTLLAHVVGGGKTFEMVAAAMESKRLGLCQKSLFVVPNHLTEQWAAEFLQLYPSANILVATKKDFETRNRKKFCSRIATGDYDAVIIGHSQFEKIPMSLERQRAILQTQLDEIIDGILEAKRENAERFTIKQMEKSKRSIKLKLDKLNDQTRKDDVVTFEELGVDRLFVDEAHSFKNLFLYTKMRNVAGLAQTEAQKSSDLFMKCRYMDELTGNRGIVFATGTPISNSMTEMYTMQRYLQYDALCSHGLQHFDAWASTFGETITAIELAPEGTGYRAKTRFARFYNLPELISMFKQVADVQTADMLKLPIPEAEYHNEVIKPSKFQTDMVASFSERAEKVRNGMVDATVDNMLKITNDGRKLALDQRLTDDLLPDDPESKVNLCLDNIHRIWESSSEQKSTQLVFCDLSTPHGDGKFNVYNDLKAKLIRMGVPEAEIAFIHDAKTEAQKAALFTNVRSGNVRILLGSTAKMGAGTNVQKRLIAEHHLDIPWRPSDIEQREGRILRQGNENSKVDIFRYVTENTFDSYMWQTIESKQKFISQIMTSKSPVRSCEDVDETALSYAEIKALATGNPYIREKMDLEIEVSRLKLVKANYLSQKYMLEDSLLKHYPREIRLTQERIKGYEMDIALYGRHKSEDFPGMLLYGTHYEEKKEAGTAILEACKAMTSPEPKEVGSYRGFTLLLSYDIVAKVFRMTLRGELSHTVELGSDIHGNIQRIENMLESLPSRLSACEKALATLKEQMANAKAEVEKPFEQEQELSEKAARLAELDALLNMDKRENAALDAEPEHTETEPVKTFCKER